IQTFAAISRGITFASMWLLGDFLPKKAAFLLSVVLWFVLSIGAVLVTAEQFWLFLLLQSFSSVSVEVFRILVNVLQAEYFGGKHLSFAMAANIIGESLSLLLSSTINSFLVANERGWQLGKIISPACSIPLLISSAIPIVYAMSSTIATLVFAGQVMIVTKSLPILTVS
ncbi:hypothetical protein PMAYCL1PPCAC_05539, partial [Pristionchus mayeri]